MIYISVTEAAKILCVSRQRVLALLGENKLKGMKVGNSWLLKKTDVEKRMRLRQDRMELTIPTIEASHHEQV